MEPPPYYLETVKLKPRWPWSPRARWTIRATGTNRPVCGSEAPNMKTATRRGLEILHLLNPQERPPK